MSLTVGDFISITASLAAWVAILLQWKSTKATERDVDDRLVALRDVLDRLKEERATRERQLEERILAELRLQHQDFSGQMSATWNYNDMMILHQIMVYVQFANAASFCCQLRPELAKDYLPSLPDFYLAVVDYIRCMTSIHQMTIDNSVAPEEWVRRLEENAKKMKMTLEKVSEMGGAICSTLEAQGLLRFTDGKDFKSRLQPLAGVLQTADGVVDRFMRMSHEIAEQERRVQIKNGSI